MAVLEFFFDVGSPASYLAWTQLPGLGRDTGAECRLRPMLLGAVFQATSNASPASVPAKGAYMARDLARHARRYGVPFAMNPFFPVNTLLLMRAATALQQQRPEALPAFLRTVFEALWVQGRDLNQPAEVASACQAAGLDPAELLAMAQQPAAKDALRATTEEAVARGVFGAPTMFVGEQMFFGQDRLDFVREALAGGGAAR
jgi:2-hydroxychromene-2-carboxylate isomerase